MTATPNPINSFNVRQVLAWPFGMGGLVALRNLIHDRIRLIATLVGVVFAVVLMNVEIGIFIGFTETTSSLIDHADADLWIMAPGTRNVDQVIAISERKYYEAVATPGVAQAAKLNVEFANLRRPDGGTESVLVVGVDPTSTLAGPWDVVEGDVQNLRYPNTVMIDEFYREKLGIKRLGEIVEIGDHRAQVVGFTRGIRSFTQSPYVFASTKTALDYSRIRSDETKYVLVKLAPGASASDVKRRLQSGLQDVAVKSARAFRYETQFYWMFTTGAGLALLAAAIMGLVVGGVIISQTLYATTIDHIAEYGTLRAIGASDTYLYGIIVRQAVLTGVAGYAIGLALSIVCVAITKNGGPAMILPMPIVAALLVLTVLMCITAALVSIRKVTKIDPGAVFK